MQIAETLLPDCPVAHLTDEPVSPLACVSPLQSCITLACLLQSLCLLNTQVSLHANLTCAQLPHHAKQTCFFMHARLISTCSPHTCMFNSPLHNPLALHIQPSIYHRPSIHLHPGSSLYKHLTFASMVSLHDIGGLPHSCPSESHCLHLGSFSSLEGQI